jgi:rod shape-determining protein MreD
MVYLALVTAVLLDTILQVLLPDHLAAIFPPPDLPWLTALYIGFHAKNTNQLGLAIVLGLLADTFSSHPIGHFAFLFGVTAYLARGVRRYLPPEASLSFAVAALFCGLLVAFLGLGLAAVTSRGYLGPGFVRALLEVTTSALFAPAVFAAWDRSRLFRKALGGTVYDFA